MKYIICGGGGFVGSNLREYLGEYDLLPVEMLSDINSMHQFLKEREPYKIFYLAAYGNLHGQENIDEIYRAIVIKLLNLLQATDDTLCEGFVTTGTTSEYGNKDVPMHEDMLLKPVTFYGAAKAAATHLAQTWAFQKKLPIVVYRPASITGVGEQKIHLIPTLIRSCLLGEPMNFVGDYMHDYINVYDVCTALKILADSAQNHKGEIFNVGTGVQTSNLQVKEMIEEISKKKATIINTVKLNPQNVSDVWIANSTKMRNLGWKPKYTLYETLKQMIVAL